VQDYVLRSSVVLTCRCGLSIGQHTRQTRPPTELRGWRNQPSSAVPVEPDAMRVACPCSTEARRRNPDRGSGFVSQNLSFRVIPTFYPIAFRSGNGGDAERPWCVGIKAVMLRSRCVATKGCKSAHGVRACLRRQVRSTYAGVGSLQAGDSRGRILTGSGYPARKREREKLNHERPARACR